ncbi:hypothetical protein EON68_03075 [archaeon]|nr:MAG: hypothetical protein EON68_03075 [archaeon]
MPVSRLCTPARVQTYPLFSFFLRRPARARARALLDVRQLKEYMARKPRGAHTAIGGGTKPRAHHPLLHISSRARAAVAMQAG